MKKRTSSTRMGILVILLATTACAFFLTTHTSAQACVAGPLSGEYTSSATLCLANSPYTMSGDVSIASGTILTIDPGVIVQIKTPVKGGGKFTVDGTLNAAGTAASRIQESRTEKNRHRQNPSSPAKEAVRIHLAWKMAAQMPVDSWGGAQLAKMRMPTMERK